MPPARRFALLWPLAAFALPAGTFARVDAAPGMPGAAGAAVSGGA